MATLKSYFNNIEITTKKPLETTSFYISCRTLRTEIIFVHERVDAILRSKFFTSFDVLSEGRITQIIVDYQVSHQLDLLILIFSTIQELLSSHDKMSKLSKWINLFVCRPLMTEVDGQILFL